MLPEVVTEGVCADNGKEDANKDKKAMVAYMIFFFIVFPKYELQEVY